MKTKTIFHSSIRLAIVAVLTLAGWPVARAAGIPIANASFEMPAVKTGIITTNGIPGWTRDPDVLAPPIRAGVANLIPSAFLPPSDGSQVGYIFGEQGTGAIMQTLAAAWQPNTIYVFSIDCYGVPSNAFSPISALFVSLGVGGFTSVSDSSHGYCNPQQLSNNLTLIFDTSQAFPGIIGKPIVIDLGAGTSFNDVAFDNIRLDATPIPTLNLPVLYGAFCCGGISPEQTARLSAFCDGSVTPAPCNATLEFHDIHGVLLSQSHLNLRPEETGFLDLPSTAKGREPMEVIPKWFLNEGNANFSLEVSDTEDLRTRFFVNWGDGWVAKTGNLDSGPVAFARGDTGRLKVYCDGSVRVENTLRFESCQADLAFHDTNGRLLNQSHLTLAPGTAGFLDLTFDETRSIDRRAVIIPSLNVTGGPAVGSFAVLDSGTGITIAQSSPATLQTVGR